MMLHWFQIRIKASFLFFVGRMMFFIWGRSGSIDREREREFIIHVHIFIKFNTRLMFQSVHLFTQTTLYNYGMLTYLPISIGRQVIGGAKLKKK